MDEGLRAAARGIRWFLPDLVGPAAQDVDAEIAQLLTRAGTDQQASQRLRTVLERNRRTQAFLRAVMEDAPDYRPPQVQPGIRRDYHSLPGLPGEVPAPKYCCPNGDFDWWRVEVGKRILVCPTHGCALVEA